MKVIVEQLMCEWHPDVPAADTAVVTTGRGSSFEVDVCAECDQLVRAGRRVRRASSNGHKRNGRAKSVNLRQWAREQGYEVADRGKIPTEIKDAFASRR